MNPELFSSCLSFFSFSLSFAVFHTAEIIFPVQKPTILFSFSGLGQFGWSSRKLSVTSCQSQKKQLSFSSLSTKGGENSLQAVSQREGYIARDLFCREWRKKGCKKWQIMFGMCLESKTFSYILLVPVFSLMACVLICERDHHYPCFERVSIRQFLTLGIQTVIRLYI